MSAIVQIQDDSLVVKAHIYLYGEQADETVAKNIGLEINHMWNQPLVVFPIGLNWYKVKFEVVVSVISITDARKMLKENHSYENNFIRIGQKNFTERSMMGTDLGQNSGHWLITDDLGKSTTAAHEFGHALGLSHPTQIDYRGSGHPPLMAPRGTIVDSEFQWNPLVDAGTFGGTMKPVYRRVRQEEVIAVLGNAIPVNDNIYIIGELSNIFYNAYGLPEKIS